MQSIKQKAVSITAGLHRMPWTQSDNGFTWLEPTRKCNMSCEYCYQRNDPASEKSLEVIEMELKAMLRLRKCDTMLIAGGEPLTHPDMVKITGLVKSLGPKPVILTNGQALTPELVRALKAAGAFGFVFHVDSHQARSGWAGKSEKELNQLRQLLADMIYEAKGLICAFNTTILPATLHEVADIVKWTTANLHKVSANVLIPVRTAHPEDCWDYYAGGQKITIDQTPYASKQGYRNLTALDICKEIWRVLPNYQFHSYLGGTLLPDSPKWLFGTHIGSRKTLFGNLGPKSIELIQGVHHLFTGKFLSFTSPRINRHARPLFALGVIDRHMRDAWKKRFLNFLHHPQSVFDKIMLQNIIVMQPHDYLPNGEQDECDGCPNKTYWNGRLVSECRKEDYILYGRALATVRKRSCSAPSASRPVRLASNRT
jgi:pyruvate-formate lyase-activating enzyme